MHFKRNITIGILLTALGVLLSGCLRGRETESIGSLKQSRIKNKLLLSPLHPLSDNVMIMAESDTLYLFEVKTPPSEATEYYLRSFKDSTSFVSDYFSAESEELEVGAFAFKIYKLPIDIADHEDLELWRRDDWGRQPRESIAATIPVAGFTGNGPQVCEQAGSESQRQLQEWILENQLQKGIFVKIQEGFSLLFYESACWVFAPEGKSDTPKMMLHFVTDNGFDNYSFDFNIARFNDCLSSLGSGLKIYKINLGQRIGSYSKVRVGEYNENGNLWVQVLDVKELMENKMLYYNGELPTLVRQ